MFDTLTTLIIHMYSHPKMSLYIPNWDGDSDWSSCSLSFEPLTPDENSNDLNVDASAATAAALKASTLGMFARTTNVPSPTFIMLPIFLEGALTEWMGALFL
ncbi:hypothetical protein RDI58_021581 [Solanum bulbocastanum]|uniref:Uncharacterized protein n=1 Tax=Solanum bulbocastanum TaxID=147425 RepID=A0AAN8Y516_SOLBU